MENTGQPSRSSHPTRVHYWQLRTRVLELPSRPLIMGILNVTPDSFSDGGRYHNVQRAIERAYQLVDEGADILDVGGESTRPYSEPVPLEVELERIVPVLEAIGPQLGIPVSIDTSKAEVALRAIELGAEIINDVTGLEGDPEMVRLACESGVGVCAMHMRGTPQTMQDRPEYKDVVRDIETYLRQRRDALVAAGIERSRICLDPGIGFGKTHQHNLTLLSNSYRFHALQCPLLVGASRKGFIAHVLGHRDADRTYGNIGVALALAVQQVQILRMHDVRAVREALLLFERTGGLQPR